MRVRNAVACLVVGGMLALAAAGPASALPEPDIITLVKSGTGACETLNLFANPLKLTLGEGLEIDNNYGQKVTVTEEAGFWRFAIQKGGSADPLMNHAGHYGFGCSGPPSYDPVSVLMSGPSSASGSFALTWANSKSASSYTYTVQYKITSSGSIKTWKKGTTERSATFNPKHFNTYYYFRAETIRTSSAKSGWSPWRKIHVT